jgi:mRNA-degrading endonuclease RelE of RelBE toxin-antitoxin system
LEKAAAMANHASTCPTQLYDRRRDEVSLDEVERSDLNHRPIGLRKEDKSMEVILNSAIKAQISTLPVSDQAKLNSKLQKLSPELRPSRNIIRAAGSNNMWVLRVTPDLRALLQVQNDKITVIAVSRNEQIERYQNQAAS